MKVTASHYRTVLAGRAWRVRLVSQLARLAYRAAGLLRVRGTVTFEIHEHAARPAPPPA